MTICPQRHSNRALTSRRWPHDTLKSGYCSGEWFETICLKFRADLQSAWAKSMITPSTVRPWIVHCKLLRRRERMPLNKSWFELFFEPITDGRSSNVLPSSYRSPIPLFPGKYPHHARLPILSKWTPPSPCCWSPFALVQISLPSRSPLELQPSRAQGTPGWKCEQTSRERGEDRFSGFSLISLQKRESQKEQKTWTRGEIVAQNPNFSP